MALVAERPLIGRRSAGDRPAIGRRSAGDRPRPVLYDHRSSLGPVEADVGA
jgi:hypothetical protein